MGTYRADQKDSRCDGNVDISTVNMYTDWGQQTELGGNSYVYVTFNGEDIPRPRSIPPNAPVYFKQIRTTDLQGDFSENIGSGYTNINENDLEPNVQTQEPPPEVVPEDPSAR